MSRLLLEDGGFLLLEDGGYLLLDLEADLVNVVAPVLSGATIIGTVVHCSTGLWEGTGTITYTFQYRRNGVAISGATNSGYTLTTPDASALIDCVVTATNDSGSVSQDSNDITVDAASGRRRRRYRKLVDFRSGGTAVYNWVNE